MKKLLLLLALTFCVMTLAQAQNDESALKILPPLANLKSVDDLVEFHKQVDKGEKELLKATAKNPEGQCDQWADLIAYRFSLYNTSSGLTFDAKNTDPRRLVERFDAVKGNLVRAEELYSEADKKCSDAEKSKGKFLFARFAHTWLEDNTRNTPPLSKEQMIKLDEAAEKVFAEYDDLVNSYRSGIDKTWIDPSLLFYSYANSLLRRAQFERAEPLLNECLPLASAKYGENSTAILPVLRLLSGIANTAGDEAAYGKYQAQIDKITGAVGGAKVFFDLRKRADADSMEALYPERPMMVSGTPEQVQGRTNRPAFEPDRTADLPTPAGQRMVDTHTVGMVASAGRPMKILVTVNESGNVIDADVPKTEDEKSSAKLRETAMGLKFRPLVYKGHQVAMKGYIFLYVRYSLTGKPSRPRPSE